MVLKRFLVEEECDGSSVAEAKRPCAMLGSMREVMGAQCMQRHLSKLEPFLRRVVQEEVQNALNHHAFSTPSRSLTATQSQSTASKRYHLLFHNSLPHTIYTGSRIEADGGVPVRVMIIDSDSKLIMTSGPLSTAKVEILALDGDFCDENEWSEKYFADNIIRERDGKRPLLTGELIITLSKGVGYVNDAIFTDNSSWIRSRKFRLGARVCSSRLREGRIQEAISEAFLVKDHRGESYKKHHPPSLNDEVWRLEKIGKDGAFHRRLSENGIYTVKDFLKNLVMNPSKLRSLLGNGMSNKIWEATLEHARECVPDDKLYSFCSGQGVTLIFNSIFQLIGANIDHVYYAMNELSASHKIIVNNLKVLAYRNQNDITELKLPVDTFPKPLPAMEAAICPFISGWPDSQNPDIPWTLKEEPNAHQLSLVVQSQPHAPCNELLEDCTQMTDIFNVQDSQLTQSFGSFNNYRINGRESFDVHFHESHASATLTAEQQYVGYSSDFDLPPIWDDGKALCRASDGLLGIEHVPPVPLVNTSPRIGTSRWFKLITAMKWLSTLRQLAARRAAVAATMPCITEIGYPTLMTAMRTDATAW